MNDRTPLFLISQDTTLVEFQPSAPKDEVELQELIARYPSLISDSGGELLLIQRERGIPDGDGCSDRWFIDHVFVTRDGIPVLVEVKRAGDTRLRREVVAQMLDYAANGVAYWPKGSFAAKFENRCLSEGSGETNNDPSLILSNFLGPETDPGDFWSQVDTNLQAGNLSLVFVADVIPPELVRIVEFLNEQMKADVRAIELRYFVGADGVRMLSPRSIGATARSQAQRNATRQSPDPISVDEWLAQHIAPKGQQAIKGAHEFLRIVRDLCSEVGVASTQGSIFSRVVGGNGRNSYPFSLSKYGAAVAIGFGQLGGSPSLASERERRRFLEKFSEVAGPLRGTNLNGFPSFPVEKLNDANCERAFADVAKEFVAACKAGEGAKEIESGGASLG
ncbi:MAG: hypothetical protein U1F04_10475 [Burkholderiaceae bacterium]|jgi:hypothetical protein